MLNESYKLSRLSSSSFNDKDIQPWSQSLDCWRAMDCAVWFAPTVGVSKTTQRTTKIRKGDKNKVMIITYLYTYLMTYKQKYGIAKKKHWYMFVLKLAKRKPGMFLFLALFFCFVTLRSISQNLPTLSWSYLQQTDVTRNQCTRWTTQQQLPLAWSTLYLQRSRRSRFHLETKSSRSESSQAIWTNSSI